MTKPERLLWWALRKRQAGLYFRRQHPAGPYILDFYCDAAKLCVEIDGQSHDFTQDHDRRRDAWLRARGVRTLRIRATDVLDNLAGVVEFIVTEANAPSGASGRATSPAGGGVSEADGGGIKGAQAQNVDIRLTAPPRPFLLPPRPWRAPRIVRR